ncbi:MAG: hypothetical protein OEV64_07195 [Desulfobulbaceae bacterium]|nr:hypothetical protein [Desulfobulbaceae bacterium]
MKKHGKILIPQDNDLSLGTKMALFTIAVATVIWLFLDHFQSRELSLLFRREIDQSLTKQARMDRSLLDAYIRSYGKAASLITAQKKFIDFIEKNDLLRANEDVAVQYTEHAPWLPSNSIMRTLPRLSHIVILGEKGNIVESFSFSGKPLPQGIIENALLRQMSYDQILLSDIGGSPYVLVSEQFNDELNNRKGTLMIASAMDDDFLYAAVSVISPDSTVALVDNKTNEIVSSNMEERIITSLDPSLVERNYHIVAQSFFDYGSSDLDLKFISLLPRSTYNDIATRILLSCRINSLILTFSLIVAFFIVIFWINFQLQALTKTVIDFSNKHFGKPARERDKGDQLIILKEKFAEFSTALIASKDEIKARIEESSTLIGKDHREKQLADTLLLLQTITEIMGLGVIIHDPEKGLLPANKVMELFLLDHGDIEDFVLGKIGDGDIELTSRAGASHVFLTHTRYFSGNQKITLVQDVTRARHYEGERERLINELTDALDKVNTLSVFLPICASCKKIRDEQGQWFQLESYIKNHSNAEFSHSICPDCSRSLYGEIGRKS